MSPEEVDMLIIKHAAECVQELLNTVQTNDGVSWFLIIDRKMHRLVQYVQRKQKRK